MARIASVVLAAPAILLLVALIPPASAAEVRFIEGCYTATVSGKDVDFLCYYQKDNKVCATDGVCTGVPGAGQSAVACAFWLVADESDYAVGQAISLSASLPPIPPECV